MNCVKIFSRVITAFAIIAVCSQGMAFWGRRSKNNSNQKHFVIIGTSAAGLSAAKELRKHDTQAKITCISCEKEPYNKCKLASLLGMRRSPHHIVTLSEKEAKWMGIMYELDTRVIEINAAVKEIKIDKKIIATGKNATIQYDKLLIATGTVPRVPDNLQQEKDGVFTINSVYDVNQILAYIKKYNVRTITILGAGLTGFECAEDLVNRGFDVSMIYSGSHMLRASLDKNAASFIERAVKDAGVKVHSNTSVVSVLRKRCKVIGLKLDNGKTIQTDMLICATGVKPNSALAKNVGIAIDKHTDGILVDDHMRTNIPDIYAAGDVVAVKDFMSGKLAASYRWGDAKKQGVVAAHNMLGKEDTYKGIVVRFGGSVFGSKALSIGCIRDIPADYAVESMLTDEGYVLKVTHNGQLKGLIAAGKNIPNKPALMKEVEALKKKAVN